MAKQRYSNKTEFVWDPGEASPKQKAFLESRTLYTAYGGAKGSGKSWVVRTKAVGGAYSYPGIKILIMRRTYIELQKNHIEPVLKMVHPELTSYNGTLHTLYFENGSVIHFGHWNGDHSELEYQGQDYDWIFMDEATQFSWRTFQYLGGCLRGVNQIPKRFYLTCNPGGVGHRWVKRLFVDREFITSKDNPEENENPDDYRFIFASIEDNTMMQKLDPVGYKNYLRLLSSMPEDQRKAYRYGDWSSIGGNYFPEISDGRHFVKPFQIPPHWKRYRAFDYGFDMFACGWFAVDEEGRSYLYRECHKEDLIAQDAAKLMNELTMKDEHIEVTFAPPDMWNRQKDSGKTMAEIFMTNGVPIVKADNNRVQGHMQIKDMLAPRLDGMPSLLLFDTCTETINDLKDIQADEDNPNDCAKMPHDVTHSVDMLRYYCISRVMSAEAEVEIDYDDEDEGDDYATFMTGGAPSTGYLGYGG